MRTKKATIRSKNVEFILKSPDNNLIKWGNFCVGILLLSLVTASALITVPEYVYSTITYQPQKEKTNNVLEGKILISRSDLKKINRNELLIFYVENPENSILKVKIVNIDEKITNGDKIIVDIDLAHNGNDIKRFSNQSFDQITGKLYIGETSFFKKTFEKIFTQIGL